MLNYIHILLKTTFLSKIKKGININKNITKLKKTQRLQFVIFVFLFIKMNKNS